MSDLGKIWSYAPAVLEPDLDLLGLDVAEYGALPDELLPAQRAGLGALAVDPLERLHLLGRVAHVLARVHQRRPTRRRPVLAAPRRHHGRHLQEEPSQEEEGDGGEPRPRATPSHALAMVVAVVGSRGWLGLGVLWACRAAACGEEERSGDRKGKGSETGG
jgi:hypothetical protein